MRRSVMRERVGTWMLVVGLPLFLLGGAGAFFVPDGQAETPVGMTVVCSGTGGLLIALVGLLLRDPRAFFRAGTLRPVAITAIAFMLAFWMVRSVPMLKPLGPSAWLLAVPLSWALPSAFAWLGKRETSA